MSRHPLSAVAGGLLWWLAQAVAFGQAPAAPAAVPPAPLVQCDTNAVIANDFETDFRPLAPRPAAADEPASVSLSLVADGPTGRYLRATNATAGGYVGLNLVTPGRPLPVFQHLEFDYRADPALKVNLFCRVLSVDYEIGFTGPRSNLGAATWLGQVEGVVADGQWHHASIPLLALVRRANPLVSDPRLTELCFENRNTDNYLLAGFGGNGAGVTLDLDNVEWRRQGGRQADVRWSSSDGRTVEGWGVVLDTSSSTTPDAANTPADQSSRAFDGLADGNHWVHVRAFRDGRGSETAHYRLAVVGTPPTARLIEPADGSRAAPEALKVALQSPLGIDPSSLSIELAGQPYAVGRTGVSYDAVTGDLAVELARLTGPSDGEGKAPPVVFQDGQTIAWTVTAADEAGQRLPAPLSGQFTLDLSADHTPPAESLLLLSPGPDQPAVAFPGEGTFEQGLDEWMPYGADAVRVERTDETAAAGRYSLKLTCEANGANFTAFVRRSPFDLSRFGTLSFDYKAGDRLRLDFLFLVSSTGGTRYLRLVFADRDRDGAVIGRVPDAVFDDTWRHAEVPLAAWIRQAWPGLSNYTVEGVLVSGGKWTDSQRRFAGNYAGTTVYFDNFFFVPVVNADSKLLWQGRDLSGVTGGEVVAAKDIRQLDEGGTAAPVLAAPVPEVPLRELGQGLAYVRVRPSDARGNLAPPLAAAVIIAGEAPRVVGHWPEGGTVEPGPLGVQLDYNRDVGLDLASVAFEVNGTRYGLDSPAVQLDARRGQLTWDGLRLQPPLALPNGQSVQARLLALRDQAGNDATDLPQWQFTVDYALDKHGPRTEVVSRTHTHIWSEQFAADPLTWTSTPQGALSLERVARPEADDSALRGKVVAGGAPFELSVRPDVTYSLLRFGALTFDYQVPVGLALDLLVEVSGAPGGATADAVTGYLLRLTGSQPDPRLAGVVPGVVADGQWHTAALRLDDVLRAKGLPENPYVRRIGFVKLAGEPDATGLEFGLANFYGLRSGTSPVARLAWSARDATGVGGFSVVVDQNPRTVPGASVSTRETESRLTDVIAPASWFHVRAVDGSGNWGPTTHFPLLALGTGDASVPPRG